MYSSQAKAGDSYAVLKKCITINIVDFECIPLKKLHTSYHLSEDETAYQLTDILEIHFLELPKLFDENVERDESDPVIQWMEFIDGKSKGVMEMLATKNKEIKKALSILEIVSQDEKTRMLYEAREAEIHDQVTRIESAREEGLKKGREEGHKKGREEGLEKGRKEGMEKGMKELAAKLINRGIDIDIIIQASGLGREEIEDLKKY